RPRHALRGADRGRGGGRRGARPALGAAEVALHQLGQRVDDGRDPDRARVRGPRADPEDLRLLPRPPRRGHGLDRRPLRRDRPDLITLAKSLGGGLPTGAIGGTDEVMRVVEDGTVYQVGTYNGNPLGMAAARANLLEVMTPEAYAHLDHLNDRIVSGCQAVVDEHRLPAYTVGVGAKGCVTFSTEKVVDYPSFKRAQD